MAHALLKHKKKKKCCKHIPTLILYVEQESDTTLYNLKHNLVVMNVKY